MQTVNTEDLIQFIYNETSPSQNLLIKEALEQNWNLREEYEQLKHTIEEVKGLSFSPDAKTIENILKYA
jgi:hypothetical protein